MKKKPTEDKRQSFADMPATRSLLRSVLLVELYKIRPDEVCESSLEISVMDHLPGARERRGRIVAAELQFLTDLALVKMTYRKLGAAKEYRLSAEGVLHVERELWHLVRN